MPKGSLGNTQWILIKAQNIIHIASIVEQKLEMAGNMDSEFLLEFIGYFPDYLFALSRTLLGVILTTFPETAVLPYIGDRQVWVRNDERNSLNWSLNVNWPIADPNKDPFGGVWIGLNDLTKEGKFLWADGSHVTYTNWASSQPDNRKDYENCVEIAVHGGSWKDTSCGRQLPFICEKENST